MELIDGKKIAAEIKQELADKVEELKSQGKKVPHLAGGCWSETTRLSETLCGQQGKIV